MRKLFIFILSLMLTTSVFAADTTFTDGEGIDSTDAASAFTVACEDASDSNKGCATFNTDSFTVSSGDVTLGDTLDTLYLEVAATAVTVKNVGLVAADINDVIYIDGSKYAKTSVGIQEAVDFLESGSGGRIIVPSGDYSFSSEQVDISGAKPIIIEGDGVSSIMRLDTAGRNGFVVGTTATNTDDVIIKNVLMRGYSTDDGDAYDSGTGITFINHENGRIENVDIYAGVTGIDLQANGSGGKTYANFLHNFKVSGSESYGLRIRTLNDGGSAGFNNANFMSNGYISNSGTNISIENGGTNYIEVSHHNFSNIYIETNNSAELVLEVIDSDKNMFSNITFDGTTGNEHIDFDATSDNNGIFGYDLDGTLDDNGTNNIFYRVNGTIKGDRLTYDTDTLHLDGANGRVGIGITNPDATLDVDKLFQVSATGVSVINTGLVAADINDVIIVDGVRYPKTDTGIESAIADAGAGGKVFLPEGTYTASADIDIIPNNIVLEGIGTGTVVTLANSADTTVFDVAGSNVTIRNLTINGNKANQTNEAIMGIDTGLDADNFIAENLLIYDTYGTGIHINRSNNAKIRNNVLKDIGNTSVTISTYGMGIKLNDECDNSKITNNWIKNTQSDGIMVRGSNTAFSDHVLISNNFISETQGNQRAGIYISRAFNATISDNNITESANTSNGTNGIYLDSTSSSDHIVSNNNIENVSGVGIESWGSGTVIDGNRIKQNGSGSDANGMFIKGSYVVVTDNFIDTPTQDGIYLGSNLSYSTIANNIVRNPQSETGIRLTADAGENTTNIIIKNNQLIDDQTTPTMGYGIYSFGDGDIRDIIEIGNIISGATIGDRVGLPKSIITSATSGIVLPMFEAKTTGVSVINTPLVLWSATDATVDSTGEIALDTDVITQGQAIIYGASAINYIVATTDTPTDNYIPKYDAGGGTIQWEEDTGGAATASGSEGDIQINSADALSSSSNFNFDNGGNILTVTGAIISTTTTATGIFEAVATGVTVINSDLEVTGDGNPGIAFAGETADPCGTEPEGFIFYNDTGNYMCFCNNAGADIKMNDNSTACF